MVVCQAWNKYSYEILLMDNHSNDGSEKIAAQLSLENPKVKHIRLSRNFGYQINIINGYKNCTGDAAIQLDADGEDDPQLINKMLDHWEQGYQVVYGIRKNRKEGFFLKLTRKIFYRLLNRLSEIDIPIDAGDFRLLDRKILNHIKNLKEANPYLRGLISFMGYNQIGFEYDRRKRFAGKSKFTVTEYFHLAWDGITSFSKSPLIYTAWLGGIISLISFILFIFYLGLFLSGKIPVQGFTTLVLLVLFMSGVQILCMGVLGIYIGRIFDDVKQRPLGFIENSQEKDSN